jgi:hypothetical protein
MRWLASRVVPVAGRALHGGTLKLGERIPVTELVVSVDTVVADRERKLF